MYTSAVEAVTVVQVMMNFNEIKNIPIKLRISKQLKFTKQFMSRPNDEPSKLTLR